MTSLVMSVSRGVRRETYQAYTAANCRGQRVENVHSWFEPPCELVITTPGLIKLGDLLSKCGEDCIGRIASFQLGKKWM